MSDVTVKKLEELEAYEGPNAIRGIRFRRAAKSLGVTAWGMGVIELAPNCVDYPEHDHTKDGQEEVYLVLKGSATLRAGDLDLPLEVGTFVRVGPTQRRKMIAGPAGVTFLAIGNTPGKAYEVRR